LMGAGFCGAAAAGAGVDGNVGDGAGLGGFD